MKAPLFDDVQRQHQRILEAVSRLEDVLGRGGPASDAHGGDDIVVAALGTFLEFCSSTLEPLMRDEERRVYPLLDFYLPPEIGSTAAMFQEHETIRGLVSMLRSSRARMREGAPDAEADVTVLVQDLALLVRDHVRKEDGVIHPLLERLSARGSPA